MPIVTTSGPTVPPGRWLFAVAIFLGAFLVFLVQPLIGKYILPWFGGAPAVWNACLLFFQVALLAGYAWAYALVRWLSPRGQAAAHAALLVVAALTLPIIPGPAPNPEAAPTPALLWLLTAAVGLPYVALAATGPLVQAWFARRWPAASPYPLYALSNIGSFLALIIYPAAIEPWVGRWTQAWTWSWLFAVAALASIAVAIIASRSPSTESAAVAGAVEPAPPPRRSDRVLWLALPAAASVLLSATTNLLCLDVGVVPFLWVVPLGLYLLSYVLAFAGAWAYPRWWVLGAMIPALAAAVWMLIDSENLTLRVAAAPTALFLVCWACHGEVARRRPATAHLTAFYLSLAAGGAIGGALVALVAPLVLPWFFEYHAGLVVGAALAVGSALSDVKSWWRWPLRLAAVTGVLALAIALGMCGRDVLAGARRIERSFHGVLLVRDLGSASGVLHRELRHGSTVHGLQYLDVDRRSEPTTYYCPDSGVGMVLRLVRTPERRVGVIGLGAGTLASYARPGEQWTFFEISPEVVAVARQEFTFLADSSSPPEVVVGDARLSLERASTPYLFNLLVIDAFTSDAIPVHLLTAEAFALYRRHLAPDGVIAVHISNRHLDLRPVVKRQANRLGWAAAIVIDDRDEADASYSSDWVLITSDLSVLALEPIDHASSHDFGAVDRVELWTDDRAGLWRILRW